MAFATGSNVQVLYGNEATFGTQSPGNGSPANYSKLPFISNGLSLQRTPFEDPTIRSDRQSRYHRLGNNVVEGELNVAFAHGTYDDLLASLFWNTWSENALTFASSVQSMTMEVGATDISQYRLFTGVIVTGMTLEVNLDGVITTTFNLMGQDQAVSGSSVDSSPATLTSKEPFIHLDGTFNEGGSGSSVIQSITLNIDNNVVANYRLGSGDLSNFSPGMVNVTGTVVAYFDDATLLNKFINETSSGIDFTLDDGSSNTLQFEVDTLKYESADLDVNTDTSYPITLNFKGLYDSTNASVVKVTRSA